eukprot:6126057-Lingulodinium_polyedra.AAC.1
MPATPGCSGNNRRTQRVGGPMTPPGTRANNAQCASPWGSIPPRYFGHVVHPTMSLSSHNTGKGRCRGHRRALTG